MKKRLITKTVVAVALVAGMIFTVSCANSANDSSDERAVTQNGDAAGEETGGGGSGGEEGSGGSGDDKETTTDLFEDIKTRTFNVNNTDYTFNFVDGYHFEGTSTISGVTDFKNGNVQGEITWTDDHVVKFSNTGTGIKITPPSGDFDYIEVGFKKSSDEKVALTLSSSANYGNLIANVPCLFCYEEGLGAYSGLSFFNTWTSQRGSKQVELGSNPTFTQGESSFFGTYINPEENNNEYLLTYGSGSSAPVVSAGNASNTYLNTKKWKNDGSSIYLVVNYGSVASNFNQPLVMIDYVAFYKKAN